MLGFLLNGEAAGGGSFLITLIPLALMFVVFYFLLIRPQQKRQKAVNEMQAGLKKGDTIVTIGGLHGVVDAIDDDRGVVVLATGNMKLTFDRGSVKEVKQDI